MKKNVALLFVFAVLLVHSTAYALGGNGATCNPSTTNWGSCSLAPVPFQASVTKTVNIPAGNYTIPYQATQENTKHVLQGNITADGTAIEIKASYVIIDLNGYTITYNQTKPGEGVAAGAYNLHHVSVRNGSIIQGAAMSEGDLYGRGNNPVGTYSTIAGGNRSIASLHVANLYVRYGGRDVGGVICAGDNGLYEQNTTEDTYEFGTLKNRMQGSEAITGAKLIVSGSIGMVYRNNTVINTRHRGIVTGDNAEVYGNHIGIRSIATNSGGVGQYAGKNISIHDNTIIGKGEHPIGIGAGGGTGSKNWEVYNNRIDLQITALGSEYGSPYASNPSATYIGNSASGIRVTWGGDNLNFHDNQIIIVTSSRYVGTYSPTGTTAYIDGGGKGMFLGAYAGESSTYANNIISVTGDGTYTYGVTCSYSFSEGMYVVNNTITSSQYNIVIGDDYGACNDYPLFQGNTLIKSGLSGSYKTIANTYNDVNRNAQARFVDNAYQNGASESSILLRPQGTGLTNVYFGSVVNTEYKYSYRLHDNTNGSSTLLREDFVPSAATLPYSYPGYVPPPTAQPPIIKKIILK